jgi:flagellar assembly factor FliW
LLQKEVNISNVVNITKEVKKLSVNNSSHPLQAPDVSNIATILQKVVAVKQKANEVGYIQRDQNSYGHIVPRADL